MDQVTALGTNIDDSVQRVETAYDSAGRAYLFTNFSTATGSTVVNQVERVFNGFGQVTKEYQEHAGAVNTGSSLYVGYTYTEGGSGNNSRLTRMTYPDGREIDYSYANVSGGSNAHNSDISRLTKITDGSSTVSLEGYDYLGLGAVVRRSHANGVDQSFIKLSGESVGDAGDQYTGLDRFGRVVSLRWLNGGTATDDFSYTYDRDGNRLTKTNSLHTAFNETYEYDELNQLESFARGSHTQEWTFDGLGNFTKVTTDGVDEDRTHDRQNRLTVMGGSSLGYDDNGNLTSIDAETDFTYDAWNRQQI